MNISAQICGAVLLVILIILYSRYKILGLDTQLVFRQLLFVCLFNILFDMISVWAIVNEGNAPAVLVQGSCKLYNVSLVAVGMTALWYECADAWQSRKFALAKKISMGVALAGSILICILPIHIEEGQGGNVYTAGLSIYATYVFAGGFVIAIVAVTILKYKQANPRRSRVILGWMALWIAAVLMQLFNAELLMVGYAMALGVTLIFLRLENPELMTDRITGFYNQDAMMLYATKLYDREKEFSVLSVQMRFQKEDGEKQGREQASMVNFAGNLPAFEDVRVFRVAEDEVWMILRDPAQSESLIDRVREYMENVESVETGIAQVEYVHVPSSALVKDVLELTRLVRYARNRIAERYDRNFKSVNKELVEQMYQQDVMEQMLKEAMEEDRIEVFYQPIYSTKEHKFVSAEALVRMRDREGNLIPPYRFIPVAEENGMILKLGEIVFRKVCRFFTEEHLERLGMHYIEVNLSAVQCSHAKLARDYIRIMEEYGILPQYINLEITESASLSAKQTLLANMEKLMAYGVTFSLDDFGTGQSNLNYIVDMPVSIVKFDREMSQAFFQNKKAKYVMNAAMQMIQGMELAIVSEGIEEKEQYETLEKLKIDYIQGYYFSKPLPEKEFLAFLAAAG